VEFRTEEVNPEILVCGDPKEPLADDKESCLRYGIGGKVVELHLVVVAQPPHEAARRGGEAAFVQPDEAHDVAVGGLGSLSDAGETIHIGYMSSPTGANNPPFTNSFNANGVTVDRDHGRGSSTRIG
jgi:hypothetical protein